jgi:hypothetical protein
MFLAGALTAGPICFSSDERMRFALQPSEPSVDLFREQLGACNPNARTLPGRIFSAEIHIRDARGDDGHWRSHAAPVICFCMPTSLSKFII